MKPHLLTVAALLLALLLTLSGMDGAALALFVVAAAIEVLLWLRTVQGPRHASRRIAPVRLRRSHR